MALADSNLFLSEIIWVKKRIAFSLLVRSNCLKMFPLALLKSALGEKNTSWSLLPNVDVNEGHIFANTYQQ